LSAFEALDDSPGAPVLQTEKNLHSVVALSGDANPMLLDPLIFRPEKNWFGSVGYRFRSNEEPSVPALYEGSGLGDLSVSVRLRAKRTHELIALREGSRLQEFYRQTEGSGIARKELLPRLAAIASTDRLILSGVEPDEARVLALRLLQWRFFELASNGRYYWKGASQVSDALRSTPLILMESVQHPMVLRCLIRFPLQERSVPSTTCTEEES